MKLPWPFRRTETKALSVQDLWAEIFGGLDTKTGIVVNKSLALQVMAVFRCSTVIADVVGTIPVKLYRKDIRTGSRDPAIDHPLYDVMETVPNAWQDSLQWRQSMGMHFGLAKNAYNIISKSSDGRILELIPAEPGITTVKRGRDMMPRYTILDADGKPVEYGPDEVWHWRGHSWNGYQGLDVVNQAREAIALALALERSHSSLHKNGIRTSGAWSVEGNLDNEAHKKLSNWLATALAGVENSGKPVILDRNAKFNPFGMTGVDAQHLETRRYQVEEICRGMGVLPVMAGYVEGTTAYASVEQMLLAHAIHTARPLWRSFEKSANRFLLTPSERKEGYYFKFSDGELMRGDAKSRSEYFSKALGSGGAPPWMTQNEVREMEELPRRPEKWADELPRGTNPAGTGSAKTDQPQQGAPNGQA